MDLVSKGWEKNFPKTNLTAKQDFQMLDQTNLLIMGWKSTCNRLLVSCALEKRNRNLAHIYKRNYMEILGIKRLKIDFLRAEPYCRAILSIISVFYIYKNKMAPNKQFSPNQTNKVQQDIQIHLQYLQNQNLKLQQVDQELSSKGCLLIQQIDKVKQENSGLKQDIVSRSSDWQIQSLIQQTEQRFLRINYEKNQEMQNKMTYYPMDVETERGEINQTQIYIKRKTDNEVLILQETRTQGKKLLEVLVKSKIEERKT